MKNKVLKISVTVALSLAIIMVSHTHAIAQQNGGLKLAGVSLQVVVDSSKAGQDALGKVQAKATEAKQSIIDKSDVIQKLEESLSQKQMMLRGDAMEKKRAELGRLKREIELDKGDIKQNLQRLQSMAMRSLMNDIMTIIKEYVKANGLNMVIEKGGMGQLTSGAVIYMDDSMDITDEIIKLYDEKYEKAKGAAKP